MRMREKERSGQRNLQEDDLLKIINLSLSKASKELGGYTRHADKKKESVEKESSKIDVAIITALDDEYKAVLDVFPGTTQPNYEKGASCFRQYSITEDKKISIGLFQQDAMGMVYAAILASRIIYKYKPKLLSMCGICAGVNKEKMSLGDMVAFSPVYDYRAGKFNSGKFIPSYKQREVDEDIKKILDKMIHDTSLLKDIHTSVNCSSKPPNDLNAHICVSASGASVLADSEHVQQLLEYQRDLGAIDMEAYAIAEAACLAEERRVPWLVVKGVQDFADSEKGDKYREYAANASAKFICRFIELYFE